MADAPAAPPPPPSNLRPPPGPPAGLVSQGLMRDLRRSVRLKSWSAKATDGSEKRGWLHKKLPGKSKFISCWFELDEPNEVGLLLLMTSQICLYLLSWNLPHLGTLEALLVEVGFWLCFPHQASSGFLTPSLL